MLRNANNVFSVILNDVNVASTALPAVGTVVTSANLPAGAVVLCDLGLRRMSNTEYAALASDGQYFVVQGKGASQPLMKSPVITKGKTKFSIAKHRAAVQQVTAIGYNGTSGALPVANNSDFYIKVRKQDNDVANRSQPLPLFAGPVKTDATANQEELALALLKSGIKNFSKEPANGYLKFEAICDAAGAAPTGTTTLFTPAYGSKTVAIDGTLTNVAVGDYIRLEGAGTTNAVYKVVAYTASTSIVLDTPFFGTVAAYAIANVRRITAALAAPAAFGIRLTGVPALFDVNRFRDYYVNRFTATFSDATTPVTHLVGARNGNGVWQQVAMDEYMSYGFEGQNDQLAIPSSPRDQVVKIPGVGSNTAATSKYSSLNISWEEDIKGLVTNAGAKGNVLVYLNLDSAGDLDTVTANNGETFVIALGLTAADFDE